VLRIAPFTATFDEGDPLRFLNYAIPDDAAQPDADAVDALRRAFRDRDRLPRLEWVEEAAPAVAPALASQGMVEELRTPLMTCTPDDLVDAPSAVDGTTVADVGYGDLRDTANVQRAAFGMAPLAASETPPDARRRGGGAVETYVFDKRLRLEHNLIDPWKPCARPNVVYPVLVALLEQRPVPSTSEFTASAERDACRVATSAR
jgi:hypothetical protein